MIIEHRTCTVADRKMRAYLARYEREGVPVQTRHLGHLAGAFVSEIGTLNQMIHIGCYESLADRGASRPHGDGSRMADVFAVERGTLSIRR